MLVSNKLTLRSARRIMPQRALNIPRVYKALSALGLLPFGQPAQKREEPLWARGLARSWYRLTFLDRYQGTAMAVVLPSNYTSDASLNEFTITRILSAEIYASALIVPGSYARRSLVHSLIAR